MKALKYVYYVFTGLIILGSIFNITEDLFDIYGFITLVMVCLGSYLIAVKE